MKKINPFLIYIKTYLISLILVWLLLVLICNALGFDPKSSFCVYLYGVGGFLFKGILFYSPLLLLNNIKWTGSTLKLAVIFLLPLFIFIMWFISIIVFEIEVLYPDLSFGYIHRFPHFYVQLFSTLTVSLFMLWRINRKLEILNDLK
jgi:hypothetical protein